MSMLRVDNVSKSFGGVQAVVNCSFEIEQGKITALVGPNGAGKTTVFNLISGVHAVNQGTILFREADITSFPSWKRARAGMSRTFQLSRLFKNLSIQDNLLIALRHDDDLLWRQFLRGSRVDPEEVNRIKDVMNTVGLDKDPSTPVTDLSYGQQKLFDLCRALLNDHTLLMLDEPVAGVNPVLRESLKELLRTLNQNGETILLIEHDMDFVRSVADHVIVMDQGAVLAQGKPGEALEDQRVLDAYLGTSV